RLDHLGERRAVLRLTRAGHPRRGRSQDRPFSVRPSGAVLTRRPKCRRVAAGTGGASGTQYDRHRTNSCHDGTAGPSRWRTMNRARATGVGFTAVLMWALLALLTVRTAPVPPLQLNAICFAVGGLVGLVWTLATGGLCQLRAVSWKVYAFGTA